MISKSLGLRRLCRGWAGLDAQVAEQGGHVGPEVFVVLVDGGQPGRDVVVPADPDAGQDRDDDMVPEGEQGRYGPGGRAGQIVAAGPRGFDHELLAAEFAQIVGGLAGVVGGVGTSSRDRVRSAMVPKTRSIRAPE